MKRFLFIIVAAAVSVPAFGAFDFDLKFGYDPDIGALEDMTLVNRYPQGSIQTREQADRALSEVEKEKERLARLSSQWSDRCYENFFVNYCRDKIRRARIRQERRLGRIETEANRVVRVDESRKARDKQASRDARAAEGPQHVITPSEGRPTADPERAARTKEALAKRRLDVEERRQEYAEAQKHEAENLAAHEARLKKRDADAAERDRKVKEREQKKKEKALQAGK